MQLTDSCLLVWDLYLSNIRFVFQFIPKLTPVLLCEIEHILENRPTRMRDHVQRWLETGSTFSGGPNTYVDLKEKDNLLNKEPNQNEHKSSNKPHRMGAGGAGAATPGCVLQWTMGGGGGNVATPGCVMQ